MINIYGVTFKQDGKVYNFKSESLEIPLNVTVIVETEKGEQFGKVVCKVDKVSNIDEMKPIIRITDKKDYNNHLKNLRDAEEALKEARNLAKEMNLDMNFIDANYTFDRKQLFFNFLADERVDFRELAKKLASKYKTRIELRQIGARDKAKEIGAIGICGRKICCVGFLKHIDSINMNMAKNQNIALNPTKINGCCGRLLCCLTYEDALYCECRKDMPNVGQEVKTEYGKGKVISIDILNRKYKVSIDNDIKEIELDK